MWIERIAIGAIRLRSSCKCGQRCGWIAIELRSDRDPVASVDRLCASSSLDPSCKRDAKNFLQTGSEPRADTDRFNLFIDNNATSLRLLVRPRSVRRRGGHICIMPFTVPNAPKHVTDRLQLFFADSKK